VAGSHICCPWEGVSAAAAPPAAKTTTAMRIVFIVSLPRKGFSTALVLGARLFGTNALREASNPGDCILLASYCNGCIGYGSVSLLRA
jgi:hypothetical protein